jgi:hypothetical protein
MQNQLDPRSERALLLVAQGLGDQTTRHGDRLVPSASKEGAFYLVTLASCTCADAKYRKVTCKHQIALRLESVLRGAQAENSTSAEVAF